MDIRILHAGLKRIQQLVDSGDTDAADAMVTALKKQGSPGKPVSFLSNIDRGLAPLVEQASLKSGQRVHVEDNATCMSGIRRPRLVAVHSYERPSTDLGPFWREFRLLREIEELTQPQ